MNLPAVIKGAGKLVGLVGGARYRKSRLTVALIGLLGAVMATYGVPEPVAEALVEVLGALAE